MKNRIRDSRFAGSWYDAKETTLRKTLDLFFNQAHVKSVQGDIIGLVCPHAAFPFSGQTAAYGYKAIQGKKYDTVVIFSPYHDRTPNAFQTHPAHFFRTPFGDIPVAKELLVKLRQSVSIADIPDEVEHSIEIQLPFLQYAIGSFQLLPVMVGPAGKEDISHMTKILAHTMHHASVLFIASSDMNHEFSYAEVKSKDSGIIDAMTTYRMDYIEKTLNKKEISVCGKAPILIVMETSKQLGAVMTQILHYTNSGDVTGNREEGEWTVGYLSMALVR